MDTLIKQAQDALASDDEEQMRKALKDIIAAVPLTMTMEVFSQLLSE